MAKSVSNILKALMEFCREHSDILMIAGVALIILIILFAVFRSVIKKEDEEDDFDFNEEEFLKDKLQDKDEDEKKAPEPLGPTKEENADEIENKLISKQKINTTIGNDRIESLLEEISNIPIKNLEEVEIKIQGAEVKLKYSKSDGGVSNACEEPPQTESCSEEFIDEDDAGAAYEDDGETEELCDDEKGEEKEEITEEKHIVVKKFGPNNIGTSRSGHVFTEDELERQIRD